MTANEPFSFPCWEMRAVRQPMARAVREIAALKADEVLVRVAGCGVCHTDLGYFYDGVRTRHELPLTLGHEIAGVVERAGESAAALLGRSVVVPAVIPCGTCALCKKGRGSICKKQIFPGCDVHGGFASHVVLPARGLCVVDEKRLATAGVDLVDLSVLADAISTPFQAVLRSGLGPGDVAIFVGAGGVGGFGVQIARALGAQVIALDVDPGRLERMASVGAALTIDVRGLDGRAVKKKVRDWVVGQKLDDTCWRIFETSGTAAGQQLAFGLLTFGAVLSVVGYTLDEVTLRLSNLMAFDAAAQGVWGCLPEHYPRALDLILDGKIRIAPFVERRPMSSIDETFTALHERRLTKRPILVPDFTS